MNRNEEIDIRWEWRRVGGLLKVVFFSFMCYYYGRFLNK